MIATVRFYVDNKLVAEVRSEQISEEAAEAWAIYVRNFAILVKDRDVGKSPLVKSFEQKEGKGDVSDT